MERCKKVLSILVFLCLVYGCGGSNTKEIVLENLYGIILDQDSSVEIDLNPGEPAGESYQYTIYTPPRYGVISPGKDSRHVVYTPYRNYYGEDEFFFSATDGASTKKAAAAISVNEIFVQNRPMSVRILEMISPAPGELKVTWFNSFDIDGAHDQILYHVHLSRDEDFYPSPMTKVAEVSGKISTVISGLENGDTYYVSVLAQDADGKLSKHANVRKLSLIQNSIELQQGVQVLSLSDVGAVSARLADEEETIDVKFRTSSTRDWSGVYLQLDEQDGYAVIQLVSLFSNAGTEHVYTYTTPAPEAVFKSIQASYLKGAYMPEQAVIQYYEDAIGDLSAIQSALASTPTAVADDEPTNELVEFIMGVLGLDNVEDLYDVVEDLADGEINEFGSYVQDCGSFEPDFAVGPDSLEFEVRLEIECRFGINHEVVWTDITNELPEKLGLVFEGGITTSLFVKGKAAVSREFVLKELDRKRQLAFTRFIPARPLKIPFVVALNFKGTITPSVFGSIESAWSRAAEAKVKFGFKYEADTGFQTVGEGLDGNIIDNPGKIMGNDHFELGSANVAFGMDVTAAVGPEVIVSLFNHHRAYKYFSFDGAAIAKLFTSMRWKYKLEATENPQLVVDNLGAPPFGVGVQDVSVGMGPKVEVGIRVPNAPISFITTEHEFDSAEVILSTLPDFNIEYTDLNADAGTFSVEAVDGNFMSFRSVDILEDEIGWYVFDPKDASLTASPINPLYASGKWSTDASFDTDFVLEYVPDTLASMIASSSSLARAASKQYELFKAKFLLEGRWIVNSELYSYAWPVYHGLCMVDERGSIGAQYEFFYDEINDTYLRSVWGQTANLELGMGALMYISYRLGNGDASPILRPELCYPFPDWDKQELEFEESVREPFILGVDDKYMTSAELQKSFERVRNSLFGSLSDVCSNVYGSDLDIQILSPNKFIVKQSEEYKGKCTKFSGSTVSETYYNQGTLSELSFTRVISE
ncbi:MAG: hypothetical protein VYA55_19000 [Pseudomonadota bacterium]|nr:hypothetical protein [Pseudomonadota bacterium]